MRSAPPPLQHSFFFLFYFPRIATLPSLHNHLAPNAKCRVIQYLQFSGISALGNDSGSILNQKRSTITTLPLGSRGHTTFFLLRDIQHHSVIVVLVVCFFLFLFFLFSLPPCVCPCSQPQHKHTQPTAKHCQPVKHECWQAHDSPASDVRCGCSTPPCKQAHTQEAPLASNRRPRSLRLARPHQWHFCSGNSSPLPSHQLFWSDSNH